MNNKETKKKKSFSAVIEEQKRKITIGVLAIGTFAIGVVIYKRCNIRIKDAEAYSGVVHVGVEALKECIPNPLLDVETAKNCAIDNNSVGKTINVPEYIRRLPKDHKHSQNAVELAKKHGYNLQENETLVNAYSYLKMSA